MSSDNTTQQSKFELELRNKTVEDTPNAVGELEDALNRVAEATGAEYALVTVEPVTKEQHEANEALREHIETR